MRVYSKREDHFNWKGGRKSRPDGYMRIIKPDHPRADSTGYVYEHIFIAEEAFGKPLPQKAVVHHHTKEQLVVCQDPAYHKLLHQRTRAYKACNNAHWLKCAYCKEYDDPVNMYVRPNQRQGWHRECLNKYNRERK